MRPNVRSPITDIIGSHIAALRAKKDQQGQQTKIQKSHSPYIARGLHSENGISS